MEDKQLFPPSHINCMKEAVIATLSSIIGTEPVFKGFENNHQLFSGVVGIISLVGELTWSIMLGLPKETAEALSLKFAGFEIEYDSEDMADVVGELANILAGDLIARFDTIGIKTNMSLPTVARGDDLEMLVPERMPSLHGYFSSSVGHFWVKIGIERIK